MKTIWCMVPEMRSTIDRIFSHFGPFFALLLPNNPKNQNFENMKKTLEIHHLTEIHNKWQSYDVWLMKYEVWQTKLFVILGHFLHFYLSNNPKNQNFEKMKKHLEISSFYKNVPKNMIICYNIPKIWRMTDVIVIFHFGLFFALLPP